MDAGLYRVDHSTFERRRRFQEERLEVRRELLARLQEQTREDPTSVEIDGLNRLDDYIGSVIADIGLELAQQRKASEEELSRCYALINQYHTRIYYAGWIQALTHSRTELEKQRSLPIPIRFFQPWDIWARRLKDKKSAKKADMAIAESRRKYEEAGAAIRKLEADAA